MRHHYSNISRLTVLFISVSISLWFVPEAEAETVLLNCNDAVTKVYGVVDSSAPKDKMLSECSRVLSSQPAEDDMGLWFDIDSNYKIEYEGMSPEVAAVARYDNDKLNDFGYFFFFPYKKYNREKAVAEQAAFCGRFLQEMYDMGAVSGANPDSDDLFDVAGYYMNNLVNMRLIDDDKIMGRPCFIFMVSVEPNAAISNSRLNAMTNEELAEMLQEIDIK